MPEDTSVTIRVFGELRRLRLELGLLPETTADVPTEGMPARDLAKHIGLPVDRIEGVFCNHTIHGLGYVIHPGDEVAFVPYGTPGPHRFYLGLYAAGTEED